VLELDEQAVPAYIAKRFDIDIASVTATSLGGGVSNHVVLVETPERRFVLKQSLPKLRVQEDWFSDRERIFGEVKREDIDLFEIYDDYPIAVMIQIEDLGYCKKGEGGKFVEAHDLTYKGNFPVNTGGGELSVGQAGLAGGFLHIVEALRQLRGEADGHQVKKAERALVTGIGWLNYGRNLGTTAALVMERRK